MFIYQRKSVSLVVTSFNFITMKWKIESQVDSIMSRILKDPNNEWSYNDLVEYFGSKNKLNLILRRTLAKFYDNEIIDRVIWEEDKETDFIIESNRDKLDWLEVVVRTEINDCLQIKSILISVSIESTNDIWDQLLVCR